VTPADVYSGRAREIETRREKIKRRTLAQEGVSNFVFVSHTCRLQQEVPYGEETNIDTS
jgi:hypothetical protein